MTKELECLLSNGCLARLMTTVILNFKFAFSKSLVTISFHWNAAFLLSRYFVKIVFFFKLNADVSRLELVATM